MSEPKKETVRIVLPPRRDGQPLASSPRETAMINLPPKPIQKPGVPESVSVPEGEPPAIPPIPKPPGMAPRAPVGLSTSSRGAKAAIDSRSGACRAKTAFRRWSSTRGAKASLIRRPATACAKGAGYALGVGCPGNAQVAICRGRAGYCSAFRGEQEGDGEGSPERRGKQVGSAPGIRCLATKARRTKFHLFKSRRHHYPSGRVRRKSWFDAWCARDRCLARRSGSAGLDVSVAGFPLIR